MKAVTRGAADNVPLNLSRPSPVRPPGEERHQRPLGFGSNGSSARLGARDPAHPLSRSQVSLGRITSLAAQIGGLLSGQTGKHLLVLSLTGSNSGGYLEAFAVSLSHRPRNGSVVSSLHCMNDPQPEGSHGKPHRTTKILSHARRRGGRVADRGARAAATDAGGGVCPRCDA